MQTEVVEALPILPGVAQHNDLGSWNVVVDRGDFTIADWENARAAGLPLWDLLYFLADTLVLLDGSDSAERLPSRIAGLFAGEAPSSPTLFAWVRRAVESASLPPAAVGTIATLAWLSYSAALNAHNTDLAARFPQGSPRMHGLEGMARAWLEHPALGFGWSVWRG